MKSKPFILCTAVTISALSATAQSGTFTESLTINTLQVQSAAPKPLGTTLISSTTNANNQAVGLIGLHRKSYISAAGSGNDQNDQVGIWIKGYYQNTGAPMPVFLGGQGYNSQDSKMMIAENGHVGIGTTGPLEKLHVNGKMFLEQAGSVNGWYYSYLHWRGHSLVMGSRPGEYAHNRLELKPGGAVNGELVSTLQIYSAQNLNQHTLKVQLASTGVSFLNGGNVGIGTTTPQAKLAVNGDIFAKKVKVTQSGWPDYVFQEDYKLPALKDLAAFIRKNKHLPGIPSADEVSKNGIDLGEVNKELVKKIEELTLYILEQDDKYMALEKRLAIIEATLGNTGNAPH